MSDCRTDGPGDIGLSALAGPVGFLAQVDLRGETAFAGREMGRPVGAFRTSGAPQERMKNSVTHHAG
jgi:hypothetical protein